MASIKDPIKDLIEWSNYLYLKCGINPTVLYSRTDNVYTFENQPSSKGRATRPRS